MSLTLDEKKALGGLIQERFEIIDSLTDEDSSQRLIQNWYLEGVIAALLSLGVGWNRLADGRIFFYDI